jgi:hypothetical protein
MNNNQLLWQQYVDVFIGPKCKDSLIFNKQDGSELYTKRYKGGED